MRLLRVGIVAAALALLPTTAQAALLTGTDFDSASVQANIGDLVMQSGPSNFGSIGVLQSSAYYYNTTSQVYTYVLDVTPSVANEWRLSTGFLPTVYNGIAGWSWASAVAAGASGNGSDAFGIPGFGFESLNTTNLSWQGSTTSWWLSNHTVRFFFESTGSPTMLTYNLGGSQVGTAFGLGPGAAPVPEPGSLLLMGSGAIGVGLWLRRRLSRQRYQSV